LFVFSRVDFSLVLSFWEDDYNVNDNQALSL
jgi:hypothetical protein